MIPAPVIPQRWLHGAGAGRVPAGNLSGIETAGRWPGWRAPWGTLPGLMRRVYNAIASVGQKNIGLFSELFVLFILPNGRKQGAKDTGKQPTRPSPVRRGREGERARGKWRREKRGGWHGYWALSLQPTDPTEVCNHRGPGGAER